MERLSNESVLKYKRHLLKIFEDFISLCENNSLQWCCAGGTMLGAVRHQGFIPWDDDIDVFMPRTDYNKLIALNENLQESGYSVISIHNHEQGATFAKFWDINTTLWELAELPFVYGAYIDIFPLDLTDLTQEQFLKKYRKRRFLNMIYQLSLMKVQPKILFRRIHECDVKIILKDLLQFMVPRILSSWLRKQMITLDKRSQPSSGKALASWYGDYWGREYLEKEWFESFIDAKFEGLVVKIPCGFDNYLTALYHDYMKLPPIDKQVTHHYHYFLDLSQHINIKEIKQIQKLNL